MQSINGDRYFMLCIDYYTRMKMIQFLKHKSKALDMFKNFKRQLENQLGRIIKYLISDKGGEFISKVFNGYCKKHGIKR